MTPATETEVKGGKFLSQLQNKSKANLDTLVSSCVKQQDSWNYRSRAQQLPGLLEALGSTPSPQRKTKLNKNALAYEAGSSEPRLVQIVS